MILYTLLTKLAQGVSIDPEDPRLTNIPKGPLNDSSISTVLQIVFGFGGAIALIIMALAGLRYVTSMGNPESTSKAKNAIIYASIGLAVCVVAFSLVRIVIEKVE